MERQKVFWDSFLQVKDRLMDIDALEDKQAEVLLEQLDKYLKAYNENIDFILGDLTPQGRTITFTCQGQKEFFDDVIALSESAPVMDFWDVQAFLPAMGKNQQYEYEGIVLKSKDLYFLPLESNTVKDKIGIKVALKSNQSHDDLFVCAYLLCERMIGEYNAAMFVDYFDIQILKDNKQPQDYLPLDYLPDFIQWKIDSFA